jgi:S-adenosylmethionine:tRNA ribosyltransferase-isomerase
LIWRDELGHNPQATEEKMKDDYWYDLPKELIAQAPANPRDTSKLLVYNTHTNVIEIDTFRTIAAHLPSSSVFILNDAKVVPARCELKKKTGGKVKVLFLVNEWIMSPERAIPCFVDRKVSVGDELTFPNGAKVYVENQQEQLFSLRWNGSKEEFIEILNTYGTMPIPPYIKHSPLNRDELMEKYQTVFAQSPGSSAAPTASLHFTQGVFTSLAEKGIQKSHVTLHVGLGTFAPLTQENLIQGTLHKEWIEVPQSTADFIAQAKKESKTICAVGTTVVRTLESYALYGKQSHSFAGDTDLFIRPGFQFKLVDHMITNFHLPSSSLMMLVDAFLAQKNAKKRIIELYEIAKKEHFRFYSFGDAMLIL